MGLAFSVWIHPTLTGRYGWAIPGDIWVTLDAAQYIANGALGYVYEASSALRGLPLFPIVLAPVAAAGQTFLLTSHPVARPTLWLLVAPVGLATSIPFLYASRALAHQLRMPGGQLITQLALVVLVLVRTFLFGHYEDVLALTFVLLALRLMYRGRDDLSSLFLGVGVAFKHWVLMGVPVLAGMPPRNLRARSLLMSVALPAGFAVFVLAVDWQHAAPALLESPSYTSFGHLALWAGSGKTILALPGRAILLVVAAGVWFITWGKRDPRTALSALALVYFSRALFEPVVHSYYLCPGLAFLVLRERLVTGRHRRTLLSGAFLLLFFGWFPSPVIWWSVFFAGWLFTAYPAIGDLAEAVRSRRVDAYSFDRG